MAWAVEYRGEFDDLSYFGSTQGLAWTVEIELDDYEGSVNDMLMGGRPLTIEHLSASDDLISSPIKGSTATINVWSETNFQYTALYSVENMKRRVSIYHDSTLYWRGYLTAGYTEPYDDTPYEVSLTANDGLGLLHDIAYTPGAEGRRYESAVILDILSEIGVTAFKEFVNLYEDRMSDGVGDSPFDQTLIHTDVFEDMNCYDVLVEVLKKYNAVIRQSRGEYIIYRPLELTGTTVYGRSFTAYDTKTAISITAEQLINRTAYISDVKDRNGGLLMMRAPLSKFTAERDYGNKVSWIKDHNFSIKNYTPGTGFADWTTVNFAPISLFNNLSDETEGIMSTRSGLGATDYAQQYFALEAKQTSNVCVFSFDYRMVKTTSGDASDVGFSIEVRDNTYTYYLDQTDDVSAHWDTAPPSTTVNYTISTVPQGVGSWNTYNLEIAGGLPADGPYWITLHATNVSGVRIGYKNIRLYETSDTVVAKKSKVSRWKKWVNMIPPFGLIRFFGGGYKTVNSLEITDNEEVLIDTYEATNAITAPEAGETYILSDTTQAATGIVNTLEQFNGGLAFYQTGSLSQTATDFVTDFAATYAALTTPGVILTSEENVLYFESDTPGTDFTGATSCVNASGNLAGAASTVTANAAGTKQKETLDLTAGTGGDFNVIYGAANHVTTFVTSLAATAAAFVTNHAATFVNYGIIVTNSGTTIIFEEATAGGGFTQPYFYADPGGDMEGEWATAGPEQVAPVAATARKDKIILTGTSGTATVTCHANAETATFNTATVLQNTATWSTRGGSEAKPVIELVADEIADLYSRERHFIQMSVRETDVDEPSVNAIYNFKDSLNTYDGSTRVFAMNRGRFDVKTREWSMDVEEIGTGSITQDPVGSYTADRTDITADNGTITVDMI